MRADAQSTGRAHMSDRRCPLTTKSHTQHKKSAQKSTFVVRCTTDNLVPFRHTSIHESGDKQQQSMGQAADLET